MTYTYGRYYFNSIIAFALAFVGNMKWEFRKKEQSPRLPPARGLPLYERT